GQLDETAAAEPLELIALAKELSDSFDPFREDGDQLILTEQALGILLTRANASNPIDERSQVWKMKYEIFDQRELFATRWVVFSHRMHDHGAVVGAGPRMVGDDERASDMGNVVDAFHLHAEVLLVDELDDRQGARGVHRIAAELVDEIRAIAHGD